MDVDFGRLDRNLPFRADEKGLNLIYGLVSCIINIGFLKRRLRMTDQGFLIFFFALILLVVIVAVIAVVSAVSGAAAAIADEEDEEDS